MRRILRYWLVLLALLFASPPGLAQSSFGKEQLDQMLAPVALYPDSLLSQLLMATTYPDDVAAAAQWSKQNTNLSGDAAVTAVQDKPWDPSVMSLAAFPSVLDMMGRQPDWVRNVGNAFLDQPGDVMDSVQRLRAQAQQAGNLASNEQQKVSTQTQNGNTVVTIEPASPSVVYVPSYNPTSVYGTWPYPSYPPAYYPPPPGSVFATALVSGLAWGTGIAITNSLWGDFDWGHGDVDIDVNRYNNINVNRKLDASRNNVNWNHDPARRGNTPYRSDATRQRVESRGGLQNAGNRQAGSAQRPQAGSQQARREHAQQVMRDRGGTGGGAAAGHRAAGQGAHGGTGPRAGSGAVNRGSAASHAPNRSSNKNAALERSRNNNRDNGLRGVNSAGQRHVSAPGGHQARPAAHAPQRASGSRTRGHVGGGGHRGRR